MQVEQTLLIGQRQIEQAKVQTYWKTGKLIQEHIFQHKDRADYGSRVVRQLSGDLKISARTLWECVQFARAFKIMRARAQSPSNRLTWTHYRELSRVSDDEARSDLLKRAEKSEWTYRQLSKKIHEEFNHDESPKLSYSDGNGRAAHAYPKLIPRKGELYTYRLIEREVVNDEEGAGLWIDSGFQVRRQIPDDARGFKAGQIVHSVKAGKDYSIRAAKSGEGALFTYKAVVERVVDGDTMIVEIDLGFKMRIRQYLRLRGIDAPELDTLEGKRARDLVLKKLEGTDHILLTSTRSDKYDRYLADIFYGAGDANYLNQDLLDNGLAVRVS